MRKKWLRAFVGFVWGLLLFLGIARSLKLGLGSTISGSPIVSQIVLKTALVLAALIVWKLLGRSLDEMGWRRPDGWNRSYRSSFVIAVVAMMAASVAMILLEVRHPIASQMGFLKIVLVIWVLSSFSEEVYVRGLVQSWVGGRDEVNGLDSAFEPSIVSSALLFAAMHVPLMWSTAGVQGGLPIVLATLIVGWACAILRARTRSLWPAIACHVIGNVAGVPGGLLGVIFYRLIYGRLPEMLTAG
jgi:membrane protease YdiL (CAAX protease family)